LTVRKFIRGDPGHLLAGNLVRNNPLDPPMDADEPRMEFALGNARRNANPVAKISVQRGRAWA
jgi:hypothetical protein